MIFQIKYLLFIIGFQKPIASNCLTKNPRDILFRNLRKRQKLNFKNVNWTFKLNLNLTWSCQNEPWYIVNAKVYRIRETPNLSIDADRSPNTKIIIKKFRGGYVRTDVRRYGQTDKHTDGRRGEEDKFHMSTYNLSYVSAVQCNATLQYSAVQHCSRLVHQKIQGSYLKKYISS